MSVLVPFTFTNHLSVFVPAGSNRTGIAPGSGIVGKEDLLGESDTVLVYFEGGIYGQVGFEHYETRVYHAADRLMNRYPTVARMRLPRSELVSVGTYDVTSRRLIIDEDEITARWIASWRPR